MVVATWFTADLHFGHVNIIRYCDRPFADIKEMDSTLISRWNQTVGDDDTVWVLGDLALGSINHGMAIIGSLRGRKLLLAGNHDRCWYGHGRRAKGWAERYLDAGFAEVHQGTVPLVVGGTEVDANHFPYRGDSHDQDRYLEHRPVDHGGWLLHGHVHESWGQQGRMINVGVDVCDYRPISEQAIADVMAAGPANRPVLTATRRA